MELALIGSFTACAHLLHRLLPLEWQAMFAFVRPTLLWTLWAVAAAPKHPYLFSFLALPQGAVSGIAMLGVGISNRLAQRLLYFPAAASVVVTLLSNRLPTVSTAAVITMTVMHLAQIAIGAALSMIYPAPMVPHIMDVSASHASLAKLADVFEPIQVPVLQAPSLKLDGIIAKPSSSTSTYRFGRPKFILYCGGNGELYEGSMVSLSKLADGLGVPVVMVNPKGVSRSGGVTRHADDLVNDARSVVEYLLRRQNGILTPRDVVAFGHSIGGGIAARLVAEHYPQMSIVIDRSFSTLTDAAVSLSPIAHPSFRACVPLLLSAVQFGSFDTIRAWDAISHDRKLITFHRGDKIIRFADASIARLPSFLPDGAQRKFVLELHGAHMDPHNVCIVELQGVDAVRQRVLSFFERRLSE